ncbi:MAG TPA: hypothetical protein H9674_04035 [Firmicutes bacterium]|nr:hypothetical protein [Bacillota bacterium]
MQAYNPMQDRIDKLVLFYIAHHYDVAAMEPEEFVDKFNETAHRVVDYLNRDKGEPAAAERTAE